MHKVNALYTKMMMKNLDTFFSDGKLAKNHQSLDRETDR